MKAGDPGTMSNAMKPADTTTPATATLCPQ
jgi:hypothetical protein